MTAADEGLPQDIAAAQDAISTLGDDGEYILIIARRDSVDPNTYDFHSLASTKPGKFREIVQIINKKLEEFPRK